MTRVALAGLDGTLILRDGRELPIGPPDELRLDWSSRIVTLLWDKKPRGTGGTLVALRIGAGPRWERMTGPVTFSSADEVGVDQRIELTDGDPAAGVGRFAWTSTEEG